MSWTIQYSCENTKDVNEKQVVCESAVTRGLCCVVSQGRDKTTPLAPCILPQ
jgi:hypothetical protein